MKSLGTRIGSLLTLGLAIVFSVIVRIESHRPYKYESVLDRVPAPSPMSDIVPSNRSWDEIKAAFLSEEKRFVSLPKKTKMTEKPYLKGAIVIYSKDIALGKTDAEWQWNDYDGQLECPLAEFVEEVGTVVLRNCQQLKGLDYENTSTKKRIPSYYWDCELTIIDQTIPAVIHRKKFSSAMPFKIPDPGIGKYETAIPHSEIKKFLDGLPLK